MASHLASCARGAAFEKSSLTAFNQPADAWQPYHSWKLSARHSYHPHFHTRWCQKLEPLGFAHCTLIETALRKRHGGVVCSQSQQQTAPQERAETQAAAFPTLPAHVHTITSPTNAYVRHCINVRQNRSYRDATNSVLVVGGTPLREICEAASQQRLQPHRAPIQVLFLLESWTPPPSVLAGRVVRVNEAVMRKLAGVETAQGIEAVGLLAKPSTFVSFLEVQAEGRGRGDSSEGGGGDTNGRQENGGAAGLCSQPSCYVSPQEWCPTATHVVALDGIQDPGNLGTLLRTALAFNWDGVFLLPGCCDPFNDKALRSSRGAVFRLHLAAGDWTHFQSVCSARELACFGGDPEYATYPPVSFEQPNGLQRALQEQKISLVLGNESNGLSSQARKICQPVAIPMAGDMESLNVAVAGGILMYLLRPQES